MLTLPDGVRGSGQIQVSVTVDSSNVVPEANAAGDAETNNVGVLTFASSATPYADLKAMSVQSPSSGRGGESTTFQWTVSNIGQAGAQGPWSDRLLLSPNAVIGDGDDVVLATVAHAGGLAAGATYTATATVTLPLRLTGTWYVSLVVDALAQVTEPDARVNNTLLPPVPIALTSPFADLQVEIAVAPAQVIEGTPVALSWRIRNNGDGATDATQWQDAIYLSTDTTLGNSDLLLGLVGHAGTVAVGDSYTVSTSIQAPLGIAGVYYVLVDADHHNSVYEGAFDGNNVGASIATMQLLPAPSPDLTVQAVGGPASLVAGLSATFTWTVANVGEATAGGSWTDTIYLSHDGSVLGALAIASVVHAQPLAAAGTYTASVTVTLPAPTDGSYRIVVVTDANGQVFEHGREANNTGASTPVDLGHMNLTATAVTAPPSAQSAGAIDVQWSVTNTGTSTVTGTWNDQLYLSQDGLIGSGDRLLTTITHTVPLGPQATYVVSAGITLPVDVSGAWQLIVRVDANGAVVEPNAENDNVASAPITIALAPYADLASAVDSAPTQLIADPARVTVTWTVTNNGTGASLTSSWTDNVVLSRDSVAGNGDDIVLGRFTHDGPLAVGTSYSRTERCSRRRPPLGGSPSS